MAVSRRGEATIGVRGMSGVREVASPRFVGREREVSAMLQALSRAPAVVLVEGEAGIGKSRLIQEALARRVGRDLVLVGGCPVVKEPFTLGPIIDAVREEVAQVADLGLSQLAGALRPLFPEWVEELPPPPEPLDDAAAARHRLFRALAELLERLHVAVLVIEDAHWADEATLEFLLFLLARSSAQSSGVRPPSIVVTYRPEEVSTGSALRRVASRLTPGTTHALLALLPLDATESADLVSSMLAGEPVSKEFACFVQERTDGLPLAIEGLVRLLADRADIFQADGSWERISLDEVRVPPTVRDSTLERVGRLTPDAQGVLQAAAVLADWVPEDVLRAVASPSERADAAVLEAQNAGLLVEDARGRLGFRHILARKAIYEATPAGSRRQLHLRAGDALEALDPRRVNRLARHFKAAHAWPRWLQYAERAADASIDVGDNGAGVAIISELLAEATWGMPDRLRLARKLVRAALTSRDKSEESVRAALNSVRGIANGAGLCPADRAEFRVLVGHLLFELGEFDAGYAELEEAIPDLVDAHTSAQAMVLLGWPIASPWPARVHLTWLRRAAVLESKLTSESERFTFAVSRAIALLQLGEAEGWELAARMLDCPPEEVDEHRRALASLNIGLAALGWGRYDEARMRLSAALETGMATGHTSLQRGARVNLMALDWAAGDWQAVGEWIHSLAPPPGDRDGESRTAHLVMAQLDAVQGRATAAGRRLQGLLEIANHGRGLDLLLDVAAALGRLRLSQGDVDGAMDAVDKPAQLLVDKAVWIWGAELVPVAVETLIKTGRADDAKALVRDFAAGLRGRDAPGPRAGLAMAEALVEQAAGEPRAATYFRAAARAYDALPRPYDALRARDQEALCLLGSGRSQDGLELLSSVFHALDALGATVDAGRVRTELRQHGVDVRSSRRGGRPSYEGRLSPREREVVELVVSGCTNRQIAEQLVLSPRTVAGHVVSAMRKLHVSSRTALAVRAVELDSEPPDVGHRAAAPR